MCCCFSLRHQKPGVHPDHSSLSLSSAITIPPVLARRPMRDLQAHGPHCRWEHLPLSGDLEAVLSGSLPSSIPDHLLVIMQLGLVNRTA
jgi:hypothetical protein